MWLPRPILVVEDWGKSITKCLNLSLKEELLASKNCLELFGSQLFSHIWVSAESFFQLGNGQLLWPSVHFSPFLGQGVSLLSCVPWLEFWWLLEPDIISISKWGLPSLHPAAFIPTGILCCCLEAASWDWVGSWGLAAASRQLLLVYSQELNECRSQYRALSVLNQILNRFRFCSSPTCLKWTILEWSTKDFRISLSWFQSC